MTRKCQGFSVVSTPGPRLCVALALVFIFHLLWTEGPTQPRPLWGFGPATHQVLGWFGLNLMHKEEGCVPIHSRPFTGPQAAGSSCHMGYRLAFALAVPFARNTVLSSSWPFKTSPIHCKELKHESCLQQEAFTPSQVWVHGVCGLGGLSSIAQLPTHRRYSLNVRINK